VDMTFQYVMIGAMALLGGVGAFLFFSPQPKKKIKGADSLSKVYRESQGEAVEEMAVLNRIIVNLSNRYAKPGEDLETRLMKSGYRYKNIPEYMYRRVINAAAYAMFAVFIGAYMFNFSVEILTILAVGAAIWGFRGPDISINNAIKTRSEKLQMEMGYTLEQFLNLLDAGVGYEDALANCRGIGEFGAFLAKISEQLRLSDSTADAIKKASADIPIFPEMEQFLDLLKSHIIEQQDISTPLHAMALTLREKFNNDIKKKSGSARLRALVVLIGFGGAATLVIALMPLSKVIFR